MVSLMQSTKLVILLEKPCQLFSFVQPVTPLAQRRLIGFNRNYCWFSILVKAGFGRKLFLAADLIAFRNFIKFDVRWERSLRLTYLGSAHRGIVLAPRLTRAETFLAAEACSSLHSTRSLFLATFTVFSLFEGGKLCINNSLACGGTKINNTSLQWKLSSCCSLCQCLPIFMVAHQHQLRHVISNELPRSDFLQIRRFHDVKVLSFIRTRPIQVWKHRSKLSYRKICR